MVKVIKKRKGLGFQLRSLQGKNGNYLFMKGPAGDYHAFLEVAAKEAARDCGSLGKGNARQLCKEVCEF